MPTDPKLVRDHFLAAAELLAAGRECMSLKVGRALFPFSHDG